MLKGEIETTPEVLSTVIPELQNRPIISVVLGNYHFGTLTSSGKFPMWGQYSKGTLGLRDLGKPPAVPPGERLRCTVSRRLRAGGILVRGTREEEFKGNVALVGAPWADEMIGVSPNFANGQGLYPWRNTDPPGKNPSQAQCKSEGRGAHRDCHRSYWVGKTVRRRLRNYVRLVTSDTSDAKPPTDSFVSRCDGEETNSSFLAMMV